MLRWNISIDTPKARKNMWGHSTSTEIHLNFVGTRSCGLQRFKILFMVLINPQCSPSAGTKGQVASHNGNLIHWLLLSCLTERQKANKARTSDRQVSETVINHLETFLFFLANIIILGMQEMIIAHLQKTAVFSLPKSIWDLQMRCLEDYVPLWLWLIRHGLMFYPDFNMKQKNHSCCHSKAFDVVQDLTF